MGDLMGDMTSYALADLVPFSAQVYFRLLERFNEAYWPLHVITLAAGLALPLLIRGDRLRTPGLLLALLWAWVGNAFLLDYYANLNWAGRYAGLAFWFQALLLATLSWGGRLRMEKRPPRWMLVPAGVLVAAGLAYPLITPLAGQGWGQAEVFGMHPDPTALATLGLCLMALRGWRLWLAALIPLLWLAASGLTLRVLDAPWAPLPLAAAGITLLIMSLQAGFDLTRSKGAE